MRFNKQLLFNNLFKTHVFWTEFSNYLKYHVHRRSSAKLCYPAAERNKAPISEALRTQLDLKTPGLQMLEISSGSGQHVGYFAALFPNITFQPTEYERNLFPSISAYAAESVNKNIRQPVYLDISEDPEKFTEAQFKPASFDYIFNSNLMHISPWECTLGLFRAAGILLKPKGLLLTYGPYAHNGILKPESNVNFDKSLRSQDARWGVRDISDLEKVAKEHDISLELIQDLPSNNKLLTWIKH